MAKANEIDYVKNVAEIENLSVDEFAEYLFKKPFSDDRCGEYLLDMAQIMAILPKPPAKILDIGVGSGWTSDLFAQRGYEVVGLDISPDMIQLARQRVRPNLTFLVCDYETDRLPTGFDAAVIYDSLHHAEDTYSVVKNIYDSLNEGGILITVEPGKGHSTTADSIAVMEKYGTTEKDMPYSLQKDFMRRAGFSRVEQFLRLSQLPLNPVQHDDGATGQVRHAISLAYGTATGHTSVVVATKQSDAQQRADDQRPAGDVLLDLAVAHDRHVLDSGATQKETPQPLATVPLEDAQRIAKSLNNLENELRALRQEVSTLRHSTERQVTSLGEAIQSFRSDLSGNLSRKFKLLSCSVLLGGVVLALISSLIGRGF